MKVSQMNTEKPDGVLADLERKRTCCECNWTNVNLLNIGEQGDPRCVCHGCCKRIAEERDQLKAEVERLKGADFCQLTKPGRGDCEHFIGLPGISISGQHDGPDDTKDCYDKPNGWCWACWRSYENSRLRTLVASYEALNEEVGVEFEGVDEIKEVIRLLKQERDQLKAELERMKTEIRVDTPAMLELNRKITDENSRLSYELERLRTWASKTHDELQHQSQLRQQWHDMARELADCIITGNNHGYGLRIGDEALARFNAAEKVQP